MMLQREATLLFLPQSCVRKMFGNSAILGHLTARPVLKISARCVFMGKKRIKKLIKT